MSIQHVLIEQMGAACVPAVLCLQFLQHSSCAVLRTGTGVQLLSPSVSLVSRGCAFVDITGFQH